MNIARLTSPSAPAFWQADRQISFTVVLQYGRAAQRHVRAAGVTVNVLDTNDNPPRFSARRYRGTAAAGAIPGTLLTLTPEVRVSDPDEVRSRLQFRLRGCGEVFHVSALALVSVGEERFDREKYECELEVLDEDGRGDYSSIEVKILGWRSSPEMTSALTDRSVAGDTENSGSDSNLGPSSSSGSQQHTREEDSIHLDSIVEQQEFRSRALSESSQVLTQLLGSASGLNASSVIRATIRIPSGLPVGSAIYQLPSSIRPQLGARGRGEFGGLIEMWPKTYMAKGRPLKFASAGASNREERHFAVQLFSDGGVVVLARSLISPGQVVLRLQTMEEDEPRDVLALLVDIVPVSRPQLLQSDVNVSLDEGQYTEEEVGVIQLAGSPQEQEGVKFSVADGNTAYRVSQDGAVFVSGELDFERQRQLSVIVLVCPQLCTDLASALPLRGSVRDACRHTCAEGVIAIQLRDVNDNPPQFRFVSEIVTAKRGLQNEPDPPYAVYKLHTPEVLERDTVVANMSTYDADRDSSGNGKVRFQLITPDDDFSLADETGQLSVAQRISSATGAVRRLVVAAYDLDEPGLRSMALLEFITADVNSVKPARSFDKRVYAIEVPENSVAARLPVPWTVTKSAPPAPYRWSIRKMVSPVDGFLADIDNEFLELSGAIDFEKQRQVWFLVTLETASESESGTIFMQEPTPNTTSGSISDLGSRTARRLVSPRVASSLLPDSPPSADSLLYNQALLRVDVTDVNDNGPKFNVSRLRSIAGVPYDAGYGFNVIKLQVGPLSVRIYTWLIIVSK